MDSRGYNVRGNRCVLCRTCLNALTDDDGASIGCGAQAASETFGCDSYVRVFAGPRPSFRSLPPRIGCDGN